MKTIWANIQLIFTGIGGWLGWFLGGFDGFLYALVAFIVMDYITGVMLAVLEKRLSSEVGAKDKTLSSEVGFKGIFKKVLIFTLVAIGHIIDSQIIGDGSVIRTAVIFFYLSNEGISILENASKIGLPIPQKLKDILEQLHNRDGKEENK